MKQLAAAFFPCHVYHMVSIHGFKPESWGDWGSSYRALSRIFGLLGVRPSGVVVDDLPGIGDESQSIERFEKVLKRNVLSQPTMLSVFSEYGFPFGLFSGKERAFGSVSNIAVGGKLLLQYDAWLGALAMDVVDRIAIEAWQCKRFLYGYALTHSDPIRFSSGGMKHGLPMDENERRNRWEKFRFGTQAGGIGFDRCLRDVFPLNYLVDAHLNIKVNGSLLPDWIAAQPSRGELKKLIDGLWCWQVASHADRTQIRSVLDNAGLLVASGGWE